jgi:hypothetical protein
LFLSPDVLSPVEPGVGPNRYAYTAGNPIDWSDPSGMAMPLTCRLGDEGRAECLQGGIWTPIWEVPEGTELDFGMSETVTVPGSENVALPPLILPETTPATIPSSEQLDQRGRPSRPGRVAPPTPPGCNWTAEQCTAAAKVRQVEQQSGRRAAAAAGSLTYGQGVLRPFQSDGGSRPNVHVPTVGGDVQVDWFADIALSTPVDGLAIPTYVAGKVGWSLYRKATGMSIGNALPFEDIPEGNAAAAVMMGLGFQDVFSDETMKANCSCGGRSE